MDTVHTFRSIRVRTVYLISLYSMGGKSVAMVEVSLLSKEANGKTKSRRAITSAGMRCLSFSGCLVPRRVELSYFSTVDSE
jgi:hypothetical protein